MCIALLGIIACKKENDGLTISPEKPTHSYTGAEYIFEDYDPNEDLVNEILQSFHTEVISGTVANKEISEALWTLEAYLSYKLSNFNNAFESFESHTYMVELRDSYSGSDSLLGDSILAAYNKVLAFAAELSPLSVFMIDISYDSQDAGIHRFGVELIVGDMAEEERPEGIAYFSSGSYSPVGSSCVNLVNEINLKINAGGYYSSYGSLNCGTGASLTISNVDNLYLTPDMSCCGGFWDTYGNQYKLYDKLINTCIGPGNTTDEGIDNTANGWLNASLWIWDDEESKLTSGYEVVSFFLNGEEKHLPTSPPTIRYAHTANVKTGKLICVGPFQ